MNYTHMHAGATCGEKESLSDRERISLDLLAYVFLLFISTVEVSWMSIACNLIPIGDRLDSDPTVDFLDKDAVGLNGLCSLS